MIELTADTFHKAMADNPAIACILHHGAVDAAMEKAAGADAGSLPYAWVHIDVDAAPGIGAMFGVAEDEPHLLVMREGVVLYCRAVYSASPEATRAMLEKAAQLDMSNIRREVDQGRLGRDALAHRRACPTTWRTR
ncbi:MAG: hypothetical protein KDJ88_03940 [Bauldia sp.]|nr:hypothetical protein [Bauldia sp.]